MKKLIVLVAALLLALTACGDDKKSSGGSGGGDNAALKADIVKEMQSNANADVPDDLANCMASAFADKVGVDALEGYGLVKDGHLVKDSELTDVKFSKADADKAAAALVDCASFGEFMALAGDTGLDDDVLKCMTDAISDSDFEAFLSAMFQQDQTSAMGGITDAATSCMTQ